MEAPKTLVELIQAYLEYKFYKKSVEENLLSDIKKGNKTSFSFENPTNREIFTGMFDATPLKGFLKTKGVDLKKFDENIRNLSIQLASDIITKHNPSEISTNEKVDVNKLANMINEHITLMKDESTKKSYYIIDTTHEKKPAIKSTRI